MTYESRDEKGPPAAEKRTEGDMSREEGGKTPL